MRDVVSLGGGQYLKEVMGMLGDLSILAGDDAHEVTEAFKALLEWTHLTNLCSTVFSVN